MAEIEPNTEALRAQAAVLLSQARAQAIDIDHAMSMARGNPTLRARLGAMAAHLAGVASELSNALGSSTFPLHMSDLVALEGVVHSGEASALVSEAAQSGGDQSMATTAQMAEVKAASSDTRQEVQSLSHDLFDRHIFDRYLHFASPGDEAEFRKREADAKKYIHDQLALGTPTGNLNAGGGELGYMLDAHAHGAGDSPDFMPRWNALVAKTERQHAAMKAAGQSTDEFDRRLSVSVRRFLKDEKGMSDADSEKRLGSFANPLDAAKSLLKDEAKSGGLKQDKAPSEIHGSIHLDAIRAKMEAAGLKLSDNTDADPSHGVNVQKPVAKDWLALT